MTAVYRPSHLSVEPLTRARDLRLWAWLLTAVGLVVLVAAVGSTAVRPEIAIGPAAGSKDQATGLGLLFWLVFGLLGGLRAKDRPGGTVVTFSMPFVVAATLLGGPAAGALMGAISEFEVRELRTQPLYGIFANHAVSIIAAVAAGALSGPVQRSLSGLAHDVPGLPFFVAAMVATLVYATVNIALVIPTIALKHGLSLRDASRSNDAVFRSTSLAEGILAWLMATTFMSVGFWAPMACVGLALIIWQAHDQATALRRDPMTGLLNTFGFNPIFETAVESARTRRRGSTLLVLDLNHFKDVNDMYLHEGGDEVIQMIGKRLLAVVRATDAVARMSRAGDEFSIVFDGVEDLRTARDLADRVASRISQPITLSESGETIVMTASIGGVLIERGTTSSPDELFHLADARMLRSKSTYGGPVFMGQDDAAALADRKRDRRARR